MPTRNLSRRAELLRHALDHRRARRPIAAGDRRALRGATPVGARYSPNTSRSASPHSPVVTPALAQAIEAGMMLRPLARGALAAPASAAVDGLARRARRARR